MAPEPFALADGTEKHKNKRRKKTRDEVDRSFLEAQARDTHAGGSVIVNAQARAGSSSMDNRAK